MNNDKIFVVTHKNFNVITDDIYQPIGVGDDNQLSRDYIRDNTADNISEKNKSFCEMTALYWMWKNISLEDENKIVGLVHYRRYFFDKGSILSRVNIEEIMSGTDIVVPKKRNYYITSVENHYKRSHEYNDLNLAKKIVEQFHPDYTSSFDKVMKDSRLSLYNMFLTKSYILNEYCTWLFPILFKLEESIDTSKYDSYQKRVIGFLAERLFNVWLEKNKNRFSIKHLKVVNTDGEGKVKKIIPFVKKMIFN